MSNIPEPPRSDDRVSALLEQARETNKHLEQIYSKLNAVFWVMLVGVLIAGFALQFVR